LLWSTSGFFAQVPVFDAWPADDGGWPTRGILLAFWRAVAATVVLLPFVRRPSLHWGMLPMTFCFVVMNISYLAAMTQTSAGNAAWLQYTAPLWVYFVGVVVLRERTQPRDGVMISFVALGLAVILVFEARGESFAGVAYGLVSGVTFAGVMLSLRLLRDEDPAWLVTLNHLVAAVVLLPFVLQVGIWPNTAQLPYLLAFGSLQMGIPYLLFARGVRRISGHEAAAIALLEPLLVPVWVYWAWGHTTSWWTLMGGALILTGLLVRYLGPAETTDDSTATAE
jgi:DME family drug/metabolite transporter